MSLNRLAIRQRLIDITFRRRLSHLGSCLTCLDILCDIYEQRQAEDPVVLSNGHAGLALYCVLEACTGASAEDLLIRHGTHPQRSAADQVSVSTGSLGMGLPVALGLALADRGRTVYCIISDGECAEGSVWEALAIQSRHGVDNLKVFVNANGFSAYDPVDVDQLEARLRAFTPSVQVRRTRCDLPFAPGCKAHYHVLTEQDYFWLLAHA